ncbi:MAG: DUF1080 domain-containing protein [Parabacteroides sp.]|nr:DUF1080 domain-containing protein [Parabacteroides sp.]
MKKQSLFFMAFCLLFTCCTSNSRSGELFSGEQNDHWNLSGQVSIENGLLTLSGTDGYAVLKNGNYKDFDLSLQLRTTPGGKGFIGFHTDETGKGYRIAINNDREDPVWWRMTGSLMSVRNLTKSFIKEGEWFTMNIRVEGPSIRVTINGEPVVEYTEPAAPFRTAPFFVFYQSLILTDSLK